MIDIIYKLLSVAHMFETLGLHDEPIVDEIRQAAQTVPGLEAFIEKADEPQTGALIDQARKEASELLEMLKGAAA